MASAFSHAFAGAVIAYPFAPKVQPGRFIWLAALSAAMPDVDAIGFHFGLPYDSLWGHRGMTHSVLFAAIYSALIIGLFYKSSLTRNQFLLFAGLFLSTVLHGLLDALTNG